MFGKHHRAQNEIVFNEAPKMLIRGILFNAPHEIREKYAPEIAPLSLGGPGCDNSHIGTTISKKELNLLDEFIKALKAIPSTGEITTRTANDYVAKVLDLSREYAKRFDYFRDDISTITANVATRTIILKPRPIQSQTEKLKEADENKAPNTNLSEAKEKIKEDFKLANKSQETSVDKVDLSSAEDKKNLDDFFDEPKRVIRPK